MSKSTPALLKAIEGYKGETAGSKQHEPVHALLDRVVAEVHKGSGTIHDSPGRREASSAANEAYQRNMGAEPGHDGGDGQAESNKPGSARPSEQPADIAPSNGASDHLSGAAPPPSRGNLLSAMPAPSAGGPAEIRRIAAEREKSRPDSKYSTLEGKGDGNKDSVAKAPPASNTARVGDVSAPSPNQGGRQTEAISDANGAEPTPWNASKSQPEAKPPYAQEDLKGDGWDEARQKARRMMAGKK
jgi:hypothetical protein